MHLFHLVDPSVWAEATSDGEYRPASLAQDGFVHFSTAEQVTGTANLLYADAADLVVVELDPDRLGDLEVVFEEAPGTGQAFPHVYGAIPTAAAVAVHPLDRTADGRWSFSPGGAAAAASPDR